MPDKPQITFDSGLKCGTSATGWQMGGHPTKAGKVVSRKVSFSLEKILSEPKKKCKGYPLWSFLCLPIAISTRMSPKIWCRKLIICPFL